jgi:hypothetical protein
VIVGSNPFSWSLWNHRFTECRQLARISGISDEEIVANLRSSTSWFPPKLCLLTASWHIFGSHCHLECISVSVRITWSKITILAQDCIIPLPLGSYVTITNWQSLRSYWGRPGSKGSIWRLEAVCWILPWAVLWNMTFSCNPVTCFQLTALLRKNGWNCRPGVVELRVFPALLVTELLGKEEYGAWRFVPLTSSLIHFRTVRISLNCYLWWRVSVYLVLGCKPCSPDDKNYSSSRVRRVSERVSIRGANAVRAKIHELLHAFVTNLCMCSRVMSMAARIGMILLQFVDRQELISIDPAVLGLKCVGSGCC